MFRYHDAEHETIVRIEDGKFYTIYEGCEGNEPVEEFIEGGGEVQEYWDKDRALAYRKQSVENYARDVLVDATFFWAEHNHNFYIDMDFSEKVVLRDKTKVYSWKTADKEADGLTPIWVDLDKSGVKDLYDISVDHGEHTFTIREMHKANMLVIYNDPNTTYQDILDYDYSTGWEYNI